MGNKQTQEAGDNSQQLLANNMIVITGIDEKRAREICQEMYSHLRHDYSKEALIIANSRVSEFENRLMSKMQELEGAMEAFSDPGFQMLLVEAQKSAASTERPADYDLLSELLIHRFQKGDNRVTRAGICRAVEIVDKISDDALLGLTVLHSVSFIYPESGYIQNGLNTLNDLFGKLFYGNLPNGIEWLDHLDILDTLRISTFGNLKKIEQYIPERLSGYVDIGIEKKSEDYNKAIELINNNELPQDILIDHELNTDYVRVNIVKLEQIEKLVLNQSFSSNGQNFIKEIPLSENQKSAVRSIYDMYNKDNNLRQQNVNKFMEEWDKQPNLRKLRDWWDNINQSFQITSVGKVLAHSNAQRCDKNVPPFY